MKRILKISLDLSLLSFIPILQWIILGITVDKNLINIFTLTYPMQFIYYILKSIFSTGANVSKEKDKNPNAVMSGLVLGVISAVIIFGFILINIEGYLSFMNMDIGPYKVFAIYSILQLFVGLVFAMILDKLYYEDKNTLANKYSIIFNVLNLSLVTVLSLLTKNSWAIVLGTIVPLAMYTCLILFKNADKFEFKISIKNCIKYDSVELFNNVAYFVIFLFGLSNALEFGEEYALALTFVSLITDTQWDTVDAIATTATIDISKGQFDYRSHMHNSYKLVALLLVSSLILGGCLYWFFDVSLRLVLIYFAFELGSMILYPIYRIKTCFLQLEYSPFIVTGNKAVASIARFAFSFLNSPFCTSIGMLVSSLYQLISLNVIFKRNFKISEEGGILKMKKTSNAGHIEL